MTPEKTKQMQKAPTVDLGEKCPTCRSSMRHVPADCRDSWHGQVVVSTAFGVHTSFDAREWSAYFFAVLREHPEITINQEFMDVWFANALMRGYDEREWRTPRYKRMIRRALHPWWSWKRYFTSLAQIGAAQ